MRTYLASFKVQEVYVPYTIMRRLLSYGEMVYGHPRTFPLFCLLSRDK